MTDTSSSKNWAIVLAAGDGTRLRELTTRAGVSTPKQFCSLAGGRSLLGDALARASRVVPRKRVVVVVAREHQEFWSREVAGLPGENVIVQARNRGTAAGLLLPLLSVLERDPAARIAVLPADHHVENESVLHDSMRLALESLEDLADGVTLLGIQPDSPDSGYGWIVPGRSAKLLRPVERFVEKPDPETAQALLSRGGVWNSFLFAARGTGLVALFERRLPELLERFRGAFAGPAEQRAERLETLYETIESRDFSREVLQGSEEALRLQSVPPCGWTDLGTPARVAACLELLQRMREPEALIPSERERAPFDLSCALAQMRSLGEVPSALAV